MSTSTDLDARYGKPAPWRRKALIAFSGVIALVFVGWVLWVATYHSSPDVKSDLISFDVVDDHTVNVELRVTFDDGQEPDCLVRAQSEDKSIVGERSFAPLQGRQEVTIRTDRLATAAEVLGCRTDDQPRRR